MVKGKPVVDYSSCMACGCCVQACPFSCIELSNTNYDKYKKAYPELIRIDNCIGCGICMKTCPIECIEIK